MFDAPGQAQIKTSFFEHIQYLFLFRVGGSGIAVGALFEQPSHVVAVDQGDTTATAGLSMVLAGMRCAVFCLHLEVPVGDVFKTMKVGHNMPERAAGARN